MAVTAEWKRRLEYAAAAVLGVALIVLLAQGLQGPPVLNLHAPPTSGTTLPTVAPVDYSAVALPTVAGETTTIVAPVPGRAHLFGSVSGPDGSVAGATIRIERLVGDTALVSDVFSNPDGSFDVPGVAGGRYRVHAFLAPGLAQVDPEVFFLPDGDDRRLDLRVESFARPGIVAVVNPDPPELDEPFGLAVQISARTVDANGVVRATPIFGARVGLGVGDSSSLQSDNPAFTSDAGVATFELVCEDAGPLELVAFVDTGEFDSVTGESVFVSEVLEVPDCIDPSATTTSGDTTSSTAATTTTS